MSMRLLIQGQEGADHTAFLGADTLFNIALMDKNGLPVDLTAPAYAIIQLYAGAVRSSTKVREYIATPDPTLPDAGFGSFTIADDEAVITTRAQYFAWALYDDGTGVDWGKVQSVVFSNVGQNYSADPTVTVDNTDTGGTSFAITVTIKGGIQTAVAVTAGGTGYTTAPSVTFNTPPGGTPATGTATVSGGAVTGITVTSPGSGYTTTDPPVISFGGPGTGATATAKIAGVLDDYTISNQGSGYKRAPVLTVVRGVGDTTGQNGAITAVPTRGNTQISEIASSVTIQ